MVQGLDTSMFDEGACVGDDTTGCTADMGIDFEDLLDGFGDNEGRVESALHCKHYSLCRLDADG